MVQNYRIFVASPGDVSPERAALGRVVDEVNDTHGPPQGYTLELVRWETHVTPNAGRAQAVINDQVGLYDIFVGVMWRRFGTPTGEADSGTEEEFQIAYQAWEQDRTKTLMFYFCQQPFMARTIDELDQMRKVLSFRKNLESKALIWEYDRHEAFADLIRPHLCKRLNRLSEDRKQPGPRRTAKPDDETISLLRGLWGQMDSGLQRAFSVAYNENRRAGDPGIQTSDLFAALLRVDPERMRPFSEEIPPEALPEPTRGGVVEEPYIVAERPWLSGCVSSSIRRLSRHLPRGHTLSGADIFADIAKNGSGKSVQLLRQHHIGPDKIDRILKEKKLQVVKT